MRNAIPFDVVTGIVATFDRSTSTRTILGAAFATAVLAAGVTGVAAQSCVNKAGEGTGSSKDAAMFQAYGAVLQATDPGLWSKWMASSQKVGEAPGYIVTKLSSRCGVGGLGQTCRVQATLCK